MAFLYAVILIYSSLSLQNTFLAMLHIDILQINSTIEIGTVVYILADFLRSTYMYLDFRSFMPPINDLPVNPIPNMKRRNTSIPNAYQITRSVTNSAVKLQRSQRKTREQYVSLFLI